MKSRALLLAGLMAALPMAFGVRPTVETPIGRFMPWSGPRGGGGRRRDKVRDAQTGVSRAARAYRRRYSHMLSEWGAEKNLARMANRKAP